MTTPSPITIQPLCATADHAARLRDLRLRALAESPDAFGSTLADTVARPLHIWQQQLQELQTFVAVLHGQDMGLVRGGPYDGRPGTAILLSMWVAPDARRSGAGGQLIDAVVEWARSAGFNRMMLDVGTENAPAIGLYARHGFVPTGRTGSLPPPREHVAEFEMTREL